MTIREVATELRLSEGQVRVLIKKGEFPSRRIGGSIRVLRSDLLQYLKAEVELSELRKAEAEKYTSAVHDGEPDPRAECLAKFADRWRLNTMKRN